MLRSLGICLLGTTLAAGCGSYRPRKLTGEGRHFALTELNPYLREGEIYHWDLTIGSLAKADLKVRVGGRVPFRDEQVVPVYSHFRTRGFTRWFRDINEAATTWVDADSMQMVERRRNLGGGKKSIIRRDKSELAIQGKSTTKQHLPGSLPVVDFQVLLLSMRSWKPEFGRRTSFSYLAETRVWETDMEYSGTQVLSTKLGKLRAHRFDGIMHRLERDGSHDGGRRRGFTVWVSADSARLPLKLVADTPDGSVVADLVNHTDPESPRETRRAARLDP